MNQDQEDHLKEIITLAAGLLNDKYRRGQEQHGGNLKDLTVTELIDEALMENIDQFTYLATAKAKLMETKKALTGTADFQVRK